MILSGTKLKGLQISYGIFDPEDPLLDNYLIKGGLAFTIIEQRFWSKRMHSEFTMDDEIFKGIKKSTLHETVKWRNAHRT